MEDFWMEHRYSSCCYQLEPHYEHTYQLVFLLKGEILYQVGENSIEVSKGGIDPLIQSGGAYIKGAGISL